MNASSSGANDYDDKVVKTTTGTSSETTSSLNDKKALIAQACWNGDIEKLVQLADSRGGLIDDGLRKEAWPLLIGSPLDSPNIDLADDSWRKLPSHRDEEQVQLDVNRAFVYYPNNENDKQLDRRKAVLYGVIVQVLRKHPMLCYFQGYHDIVQVFLLVLGEQGAVPAVARVSLLRIRDYMLPSLSPALKHLQLLPAILDSADPKLARHLSGIRPFFALAATLTLYAHDIQEYSDIARLYDFLLAHEPVMAIYMFAAIILSRRSELLEIPLEEPEMLHFTLSKLPQPLDLEALIARALKLFARLPPTMLPRFIWWRISSYSVLKTSRSITVKQSLTMGEDLFHRQAQQLKREEFRQRAIVFLSKNKAPAASLAAAFLVGAISIWLRRREHDRVLWNYIWKIQDIFGWTRHNLYS